MHLENALYFHTCTPALCVKTFNIYKVFRSLKHLSYMCQHMAYAYITFDKIKILLLNFKENIMEICWVFSGAFHALYIDANKKLYIFRHVKLIFKTFFFSKTNNYYHYRRQIFNDTFPLSAAGRKIDQ